MPFMTVTQTTQHSLVFKFHITASSGKVIAIRQAVSFSPVLLQGCILIKCIVKQMFMV